MGRLGLYIVVTLLPWLVHAAEPQADNCAHLYNLQAQELADLKPEFLARHNTNYSIEVPVTPPKNQCNFGGCWVYGSFSNIEAGYRTRTGQTLLLSEPYLIFKALEARAEEALAKPGGYATVGGFFDDALAFVREHGAVPADAWRPKIPFENAPHSNRLMEFLNHRIAAYHLDLARKADKPENLLAQARADIKGLFDTYVGTPPTKFSYGGKTYASPLEFSQELAPEVGTAPSMVFLKQRVIPKKLWDLIPSYPAGFGAAGAGAPHDRLTLTLRNMNALIIANLKKGQTVSISSDIAYAFIDSKTGIMAIDAFHVPKGFKPVSGAYRRSFGLASGGHQMEIVGVDVDAKGKVIKYKIKNSWGEGAGDRGFYHMYPDYFESYMNFIYVNNNAALKP